MNIKSEKLNNFHIYQPDACHNARFMAYAIYFLMLDMTSTVVEYLTPEKKYMVSRVAFIVAIYYGPAFLNSGKAEHAVLNDFNAFKIAETIKTEWDYEVGNSLQKSMSNHTWYLSPKVVVLSLGDPYMKADAKRLIIQKLLNFPIPELSEISVTAPSAVNVTSDSRLEDLITKESWIFFILTGHTESVREWHTSSDFLALDSYKNFAQLVCNLSVTNDCAERNISLIENFVHSSHNEDQRQNILLVVREHRKLITKDMSLKELVKLKPRVEKLL
ncbi:uncharacterized protein LOC124816354 [Hydra vulgaris]|uniref:uncharacterized protein LOC124816354 n=1 Tax=Hydra vulgaris TaxID=6087 RepID=UPI001F5ECC35|nr:uncharacterized protein LOC124816354 [Hydra vulgaris]